MSLETDLYSFLSQNADVLSALDGKNLVWMGAIPKGQPDSPALVLQTSVTSNFHAMDGQNNLQMKRVQFDSYAATYTQAITLSNLVRDLLKNFTGTMGNTQINGAIVRLDFDMPEEPGSTGYVFRRLLAIEFWHVEQS